MSDLTLAKADLPEGTIDAAVGEPHIVRANLFKLFDTDALTPVVKDYNDFEYTKPAGYEPLVKFLENKYQAPVIISNGAKQAVGSLFHSLKKSGRPNIWMKKPWWSLFPPLIKMHGLNQVSDRYTEHCAQLVVYPDNPSGSCYSDKEWKLNQDHCKEYGIPIIHDAAYYNPIYIPYQSEFKALGDVQVFTCSKLLGLSQLRVGFSVYHNTELYKGALEYMEHMTVGVSILSQMYAYNILKLMEDNPVLTMLFQEQSCSQLLLNRIHARKISPDILEPDNNNIGMFLWTKCHNLDAFKNNKINVVEGTPFGEPGYIRMNLAIPEETMIEVVDRLNQ